MKLRTPHYSETGIMTICSYLWAGLSIVLMAGRGFREKLRLHALLWGCREHLDTPKIIKFLIKNCGSCVQTVRGM